MIQDLNDEEITESIYNQELQKTKYIMFKNEKKKKKKLKTKTANIENKIPSTTDLVKKVTMTRKLKKSKAEFQILLT